MEPSERWLLRVEDGVLVVEFPHGTGLSPADGEALLDRWRDVATPSAVEAVVIVVRTSRACSDAGRRALRESAQIAVARGVDRFAVVGERSKRQFLKRTIDVEDVEVEAFNDPSAAATWASPPDSDSSLTIEPTL
ncbi:hypothetical protein [Halorubrum tebenquichense]|uniref:STAS/SEC14 domain-containing protein n=1 Tax=Halorubrum tebenquichense DSM 14210 TaxID=1227485 RepID=M0DDQ1_9EURY|nr:hypothetical protein [Halorubrum tebenquichense]ELZ33585.1 hypothetical protein C472_14331 [Halorubrum tebenquichense DSM 14210]